MSSKYLLGLFCFGVMAWLSAPGAAQVMSEGSAQPQPPTAPSDPVPEPPTAPPDPAVPPDPSAPPPDPTVPSDPGQPPTTPPTTQLPPPPPEVRTRPDPWRPFSRFGAAVLLGGGLDNFIDDGIDDITGLGGAWNLRLITGTRQPAAFELAYIGGAHDITGPGITSDDYVLRSGAEGALRLQLPIARGSGLIEPFALVGLGWSRYSLINESPDVTFMSHSDHQLTVPVGAGLAAAYRGVMFDARFTYRFAADDEMFGLADMAGWNVGASLGAEF